MSRDYLTLGVVVGTVHAVIGALLMVTGDVGAGEIQASLGVGLATLCAVVDFVILWRNS